MDRARRSSPNRCGCEGPVHVRPGSTVTGSAQLVASVVAGRVQASPAEVVLIGGLRREGEGLIEVPDDVLRVLQADGDADQVGAHAGGDELFLGELAMRRGGRVDDQGAGIADVGEMGRELQVLDERLPAARPSSAATPNANTDPGPSGRYLAARS